jgi:transposase-like protein
MTFRYNEEASKYTRNTGRRASLCMNLKSRKFIIYAAVTMTAAAMLSGCQDEGPEIRDAMKQALAKHSEINSYRFVGGADIQLNRNPLPTDQPLTVGLLSLFKDSRIEWSGTASTQPVRLETDLKVTPRGSSSSIELPMIIKDNKMYAHIPLLNAKDEYTVWESPAPAENLANSQAAAQELTSLLITDVETKAFKREEPNQWILSINEKNAQAIAEQWSKRLPELKDIASKYGLVKPQQTEAWKSGASSSKLTLTAPGEVRIVTDQQGFISELKISLNMTLGQDSSSAASLKLELSNRYSEINQSPAFVKDIPANTRPFEQIGLFLPKR